VLPARQRRLVHLHSRQRALEHFRAPSLLASFRPTLLASCTTDATGRDVVLSGFFSSTRIFPHHEPNPEFARPQQRRASSGLGVSHLADRSVAHMSSGEAKTPLSPPHSVPLSANFSDEPTTRSYRAQMQLREAMRELAQSGLGILLVTQSTSESSESSFYAMKIVATGPKAEMLTAARLTTSSATRVQIAHHDGYYHLY